MSATTRAEHLAWCKERALAYVDQGDLQNAFASLILGGAEHPAEMHAALGLDHGLNVSQDLSPFAREFLHTVVEITPVSLEARS